MVDVKYVSKVDVEDIIKVGDHLNIVNRYDDGDVVCHVDNYGEEGYWDTSVKPPKYIITKEGKLNTAVLSCDEYKEYNLDKIIEDGILFLAGTNSISSGRILMDILKRIDGKEIPEKLTDPRLAPDSMIDEFLKVVGDQGLTIDDAIEIAAGKLQNKVKSRFVKTYYKLNKEYISKAVSNWEFIKKNIDFG